MNGETALAIRPGQSVEESTEYWEEFKRWERAIMTRDDYTPYTDKQSGEVTFRPNKSYAKKAALRWNVTVSTPECVREDLGEGEYGFRVRARAEAPNGRVTEAWAACATTEKRFANVYARQRALNDIIATAETRATNRAILNLIGTGVVTAEEVTAAPASPRTLKLRARIFAILKLLEYDEPKRKELQREMLGVDSLTQCDDDQLIEFGSYLDALLPPEKRKAHESPSRLPERNVTPAAAGNTT